LEIENAMKETRIARAENCDLRGRLKAVNKLGKWDDFRSRRKEAWEEWSAIKYK
jgi:hypothetical protein